MRRIILLISLLLTSAPWALAKDAANQTTANREKKVHVIGCVVGEKGNLSLLDNQGETLQLTGKTKKLDSLVGQRVRLSGRISRASTRPEAMSGNAGEAAPTLNVSGLLDIYESCQRQ